MRTCTLVPATLILSALAGTACGSGTLVTPPAPLGGSGDSGDADGGGGDVGGGDSGDDAGTGDDTGEGGPVGDLLAAAITAEGLMAHLEALDQIGLDHSDTRSAGAEGYTASTEYVVAQLEGWGYEVEVQAFDFYGYTEDAPAELELGGAAFGVEGEDFTTFAYSDGGTATGTLVAVDLQLPPGDAENSSSSGCEAADYADFPAGAVALVQRGSCTFSDKVSRAADAGAAAVIIFNEGQPGRQGLVGGYLGGGSEGLPVLDATFDLGERLADLEGSTVTVRTRTTLGAIPSVNVIAETSGGDPDKVLMVGSHLDSVSAGPGINDNGSGSATVLEIARAVVETGYEPEYRLRFAWWGAEELGLLGSAAYVDGLSGAEGDRLIGYLNYDMVASPNGARFVYDGDGSDSSVGAGPRGSDDIEEVFLDWFEAEGQETLPTAFDGRSDYGPFIYAGIPAGGLFSGAEGTKSGGQAEIFGGKAGEAFDACYHRACDTLENIDEDLFVELARAAAHATEVLSRDPILADSGKAAARPDSEGGVPREVPVALVQSWEYEGCGHARVR